MRDPILALFIGGALHGQKLKVIMTPEIIHPVEMIDGILNHYYHAQMWRVGDNLERGEVVYHLDRVSAKLADNRAAIEADAKKYAAQLADVERDHDPTASPPATEVGPQKFVIQVETPDGLRFIGENLRSVTVHRCLAAAFDEPYPELEGDVKQLVAAMIALRTTRHYHYRAIQCVHEHCRQNNLCHVCGRPLLDPEGRIWNECRPAGVSQADA